MKNFLLSALLFIGFGASASHIVGGEVYYDSLGNNQYRITFEVYRDCSGAAYDTPLWFTVFNANGSFYSEYSISLPVPDTLPVIYDDPCVTPPTDICVERAIYVGIFTLPSTSEGYYISYQRCCWAANIQNIVNPGSWGITITTFIPGTNTVSAPNNSARFNEYPPIVLCSGQTLDFDHSAFDLDGDSLVYTLCDPLTVSSSVSEPNPENPAPYTAVPWEPGFSGTVPFGPGSNVIIDSQTGMMNITPGVTGTYVASVCVEEWRDGVLINTKSRTFGYRVVVCDVIEPMQVNVLGLGTLIEDCGSTGFIVSRDDTTTSITLQLFLSGTSTNGEDYNFLPDTIIMPIGVATDTISITPFLDNLVEGDETLIFNIVVENICDGTYDTTTAYVIIQDYTSMTIDWLDSLNLCDETGENGLLWCAVGNGIPPYGYYWEPLPSVNNDTLIFSATILDENLNMVYVTALDQCGKTIGPAPIKVYNRCPVSAPNVITANSDGINDLFIVKNLGDYDRVKLVIVNRWGNLLFESDNYLNNWDGKDKGGKELEEGVYFYTVIPESEKYIYDEPTKSQYIVHGFFHIIKD
jgi:gliding motility-associated-like protein